MDKRALGKRRLYKLWSDLIGNKHQFSVGNRMFNVVCAISLILLGLFIPYDFLSGQATFGWIFVGIFILVAVLYYFSRFKKSYHAGAIIFSTMALLAAIPTYFIKDGFKGPTVLGLLLSFKIATALNRRRNYPLWMLLHVLMLAGLLLTEYLHPEWISNSYTDTDFRMLDLFVVYTVVLVFTIFLTSFMRSSFMAEKTSAEQRAEAIETQHLQIAAQHLQLERLNQEKNKLFSIISHDLKSPLDSIRSYLELLSEQSLTAEEREMFERELHTVTTNTADLLQNLLSWSRSQMEGAVARPAVVNMYDVLHESLDVQEYIAGKKDIRLTYSIDDSIQVIADPDMLQLVVRNLVNNAIKFTDEGGSIRVKSYLADDGHCELVVKDTGKGIPEEKRQDIFTFKTESTYGTQREKGVGLGLVLCKEFIELQGGKIWFDSKEGEGTSFYISLPAYKDPNLRLF